MVETWTQRTLSLAAQLADLIAGENPGVAVGALTLALKALLAVAIDGDLQPPQSIIDLAQRLSELATVMLQAAVIADQNDAAAPGATRN